MSGPTSLLPRTPLRSRFGLSSHPPPNESSPGGSGRADLDLVQRARARDPVALERFFHRMRCVAVILNGLNRRRGRPLDEHEVADLVQDALTIVWRKLDRYAGEGTLEFWVYRICAMEFMNGLRRRQRRPRASSDQALDVPAPAPATGLPDDECRALHEGLRRLGPPGEAIIRLKHFERLTFDEIGERLSLSPNTAKTLYYRGLTRLGAALRAQAAERIR